MPWRWCLWLSFAAAMRIVQEDAFPSNCTAGTLHLAGRYKVASVVTIHESCHIVAAQAVVLSDAALLFKQDVFFQGSIHFVGSDRAAPRCVEVEGKASIDEATLTFEACGNVAVEDGGGIYVEKDLAISNSEITFQHCRAEVGGGAFIGGALTSRASKISVFSCHAAGGGGGLFVSKDMSLDASSRISFESCSAAEGEGGGLNILHGNLSIGAGSNMSFKNCSAVAGGGIFMASPQCHLEQGGSINMSDCRATHSKGGGAVLHDLTQAETAEFNCHRCEASYGGGGFSASGKVILLGSSNFEDCDASDGRRGAFTGTSVDVMGKVNTRNTSAMDGGAICTMKTFKINGGEVRIRQSRATHGGAVMALSLKLMKGLLQTQDTKAKDGGGSIHVQVQVLQVSGRLVISNTTATSGGAIQSPWLVQKGGSISVSNSAAKQIRMNHLVQAHAGAFALAGGIAQAEPGEIVIRHSSSEGDGGAVTAHMILSHGKLSVSDSLAAREGGGIKVIPFFQVGNVAQTKTRLLRDVAGLQNLAVRKFGVPLKQSIARVSMLLGNTTFENCRAQIGGAISSGGTLKLGQVMFSNCSASSIQGGAALVAKNAHFMHSFEARNCSTPKGSVLTASRELWMKNATFQNCSSPQVAAAHIVTQRVVVEGSGAALLGVDRHVEALECDNGFEGYVDEYGTNCRRCANGYFQLQGGPKIVNGTIDGHLCVKVPQQTREATAEKVRLRRGYMVQDSNISLSLHCPNEMACPGGRITRSGFGKMCEIGYQGPGCVNCAQTHGRGSGDPFTCSRCATSTVRKVAEWTIYILEQTLVFAISASGVIFAGEESYESTIYSNQLMSYVMVSLPVLRQLQNSKSFKTLASYVQEVIEGISIPVDGMLPMASVVRGSLQNVCLIMWGFPKRSMVGMRSSCCWPCL